MDLQILRGFVCRVAVFSWSEGGYSSFFHFRLQLQNPTPNRFRTCYSLLLRVSIQNFNAFFIQSYMLGGSFRIAGRPARSGGHFNHLSFVAHNYIKLLCHKSQAFFLPFPYHRRKKTFLARYSVISLTWCRRAMAVTVSRVHITSQRAAL